MKYTFSAKQPQNHFLSIKVECSCVDMKQIVIQLPAWRPGRYELGNFAKNIKDFKVEDNSGSLLEAVKTTKDRWVVDVVNSSSIVIHYDYYAAELNAGATWLDEHQMYVNPVNCCVYVEGKEEELCEVVLDVSDDYEVASSLTPADKKNVFTVANFQELADTPFIASDSLQYKIYESNDVRFYIWFQGEVKPEWDKVMLDFQRFTDYQIQQFGDFPVKEYHFLNEITTYPTYHGVEHQKSTVIALGPSYKIFKDLYAEFLGVSSHELYHTWNIKFIRPEEMQPYNFAKENYSRLGYVAEGVTTYMGDRILYECGVFDRKQYFKEFENYLLRHYHNDGINHYSVADSSWDTWLDGYVAGVPGRKTSIYTEGALIAYICDMRIRSNTNNEASLHTVMRELYQFVKEQGSYTESDYKRILERVGQISFDDVFRDLINGTIDFTPYLNKALAFEGWEMKINKSKSKTEQYGIKGTWKNDAFEISIVKEGSAAELSGFVSGDKIHSINGVRLDNNLNDWLQYFQGEVLNLSLDRNGVLKKLSLVSPTATGFHAYQLAVI